MRSMACVGMPFNEPSIHRAWVYLSRGCVAPRAPTALQALVLEGSEGPPRTWLTRASPSWDIFISNQRASPGGGDPGDGGSVVSASLRSGRYISP